MAVDQHGRAEIAVHAGEQPPQRAVIGLVEALDPAQRVVDRNALVVDFLRVADHARDRAEPAGDPHRAGVGERRQPAVEHARVELIGLAVDVDIAAREVRPHQRIAARHHARDQFVDEAVLGAPQASARSSRDALQERRADRSRPLCGELNTTGPRQSLRLDDLERRIEFVLRSVMAGSNSVSRGADAIIGARRPISIVDMPAECAQQQLSPDIYRHRAMDRAGTSTAKRWLSVHSIFTRHRLMDRVARRRRCGCESAFGR